MSGYSVGIDFGTSNTVAILRWPDGRTRPLLFDGQPVLPSAIFLAADGTLHAGRDAQRMAQFDPAGFEPNPKRRVDEDTLFLGDRAVPNVEVLAAPLRAVARVVTDTAGHLAPATLTCPAAWGPARRERLRQAAARAGWPHVGLIAEPVAAARYFTATLRRPVPPGGVLAVFDFGGGTLDVALVRNDGATFTVVGSGGAEDLGGLDIDAAIVNHLGQFLAGRHPQAWAQIVAPADELGRRNRRLFWDDVRAAKEMLSRSTTAPIAVPGVNASLHLTRDELETLATPIVRRATGELTRALHRANLTPDRLSGIFLVGGTSRVPLVSRLLHVETGVAPTVLEQPELPVAEGAIAGPTPTAAAPGAVAVGAPVPVSPSGGMWVAVPPPPPPARYRIWPWLLGSVAVIVFICTAFYQYFNIGDETDPLTVDRRVTIAGLAPDGLRTTLIAGHTAYAVGQRADGKVEVAAADLDGVGDKRLVSTESGTWASVRAIVNWVAVFSEKDDAGTRTVVLFNPTENKQQTLTLGKDEELTFSTTVQSGVPYYVYSPATSTVRGGFLGSDDEKSAKLPKGVRLLSDMGLDVGDLVFVGSDGKVLRYTGGDVLLPTGSSVPKGHPANLMHYSAYTQETVSVEDEDGYEVIRAGQPTYRGPAGRHPVWIGGCGFGYRRVCVVDQLGDDPASRVIVLLDRDGPGARVTVPNAVVPGLVGGVSDSPYLAVPTRDGDRTGTVVLDAKAGGSKTLDGDLHTTGGRSGILVAPKPAGAAQDWSDTPQSLSLTDFNIETGAQKSLGAVTVRPASCDYGGGWITCAGPDDFTIWKIA